LPTVRLSRAAATLAMSAADRHSARSPGSSSPRLAKASDLPSIRRLNTAAYAVYLERMDQPPAPVTHDYAAEVAAGAVWLTGEPAVGVIVLIPAGDSLLIENIAVSPSAQGAGIGRQLMRFAEQQAAALGLDRLTLYTNEVMVENLAIYARLGYRETGRRSEDGFSRVFMEKRLLRVVTCRASA
jgi:ribosomal protein S18 acetylase RimI-like enzyme